MNEVIKGLPVIALKGMTMKLAKIGLIALCSAVVVLTGCAKKSDNLTIKL